jgi:hypothetical protein
MATVKVMISRATYILEGKLGTKLYPFFFNNARPGSRFIRRFEKLLLEGCASGKAGIKPQFHRRFVSESLVYV